jgi:hypothetical protein
VGVAFCTETWDTCAMNQPTRTTAMTSRSRLGEACAAYATFCADARVEGADLSNWTDRDSRDALVPAFDDELVQQTTWRRLPIRPAIPVAGSLPA